MTGGTHATIRKGMPRKVMRRNLFFAFALSEPIQVDKINADLKDGVLTVTVPKAQDRGARRIQVS